MIIKAQSKQKIGPFRTGKIDCLRSGVFRRNANNMERTKLSSAGLLLALSALLIGVGSAGLALVKSNANVQETKATDFTETSTYVTAIAVQPTDSDVNARIHIKTATNDWTTQEVIQDSSSGLNYKTNILVDGATPVYDYYQFRSADSGYLSFLASQTKMSLDAWKAKTITINSGCQFPSYAFAKSGTATCYKQNYTATFKYAYTDGNGFAVFSEQFTTKDETATPTSILVQHNSDTCKTFHVRMPKADYTVASSDSIPEKNYNIMSNPGTYVYVNGTAFSGSIGWVGFRADGDGSASIRLYFTTAPGTINTILFKAGAQFPSYVSETNHLANGNAKSYTLSYDVTLANPVETSSGSGMYLYYPKYVAHTDNHVNALKLEWMSDENETRLNLNLNICDWDGKFAGYIGVNTAYTQYLDIASHILVNGTTPITFTHGISSIESWFNLNVSGSWLVQNSFVMDVAGDISTATSITITAGLQIPMYNVTSGATIQNICYQTPADATYKIYDTGTTKRFAEVKTAEAVMNEFTTYCDGVCASYDGSKDNSANLAKYFTWLSTEYSVMDATEKTNINTTNYANEVARYKYLVNKYTTLNDFLGLRNSGGAANEMGLITTTSAETWLIAGLAVGAAAVLAFFWYSRKRKDDRA